ncbi:MAG: DUF2065 domain-containing protein [Erythrobacter sp.]
MITTSTALTLHLAALIGAYMVAAGIGGVIAPKLWLSMFDDFRAHPGLTYLAAVLTFTIGAILVSLHHHWSDPLASLVSLFGWAALIEGLIALAAPQLLLRMADVMLKFVRVFAAITALFGALLLFAGLTGSISN